MLHLLLLFAQASQQPQQVGKSIQVDYNFPIVELPGYFQGADAPLGPATNRTSHIQGSRGYALARSCPTVKSDVLAFDDPDNCFEPTN